MLMIRILTGIVGFVAAVLLAGGAGGATVLYITSRYMPAAGHSELLPLEPVPPVKPCISRDDAGSIFNFAKGLSGEADLPVPAELAAENACLEIEEVISIACKQLNGGYGGEKLCANL